MVSVKADRSSSSTPVVTKTKTQVKTKEPDVPDQPPPEVEKATKVVLKFDNKPVPMWKLIILGDDEYDKGYAVGCISKVVTVVTRKIAEEKFLEAQKNGSSQLTLVPQVSASSPVGR
jgi:hypothetical protein